MEYLRAHCPFQFLIGILAFIFATRVVEKIHFLKLVHECRRFIPPPNLLNSFNDILVDSALILLLPIEEHVDLLIRSVILLFPYHYLGEVFT